MSYLCYTCMCLFTYSGVQRILCCVFVLFFFVLCSLCCQFLWIVHFWLFLRYSSNIYLESRQDKNESMTSLMGNVLSALTFICMVFHETAFPISSILGLWEKIRLELMIHIENCDSHRDSAGISARRMKQWIHTEKHVCVLI